jgi:hypothetical protein
MRRRLNLNKLMKKQSEEERGRKTLKRDKKN